MKDVEVQHKHRLEPISKKSKTGGVWGGGGREKGLESLN